MAAALCRLSAPHADWSENVDGRAATFSFEAFGPPPPGPVATFLRDLGFVVLLLLLMARFCLEWAVLRASQWGIVFLVVAVGVSVLTGWLHPTTRMRRARAMSQRPSRPPGSVQPFVLRISPSELSLTSDGVPWIRPVALDRITGFWGDRHLHVEVRDGGSIVLPCCLRSGDHRSLAAALDRQLVEMRAPRARS